MDSYKTIRKGGSLFRMLSLVLIFLIVPACSSTPDKEEQQSLGRKSYEEAISMQSLNMMDEMLAKLREAVQHDPNEPLYHLTLANALFSVEKLEEAEMYYKSAIKLNPQLTEGYRQLGRLYMQKADWKNAETYLEEAINRPGLSQPHELYNWLAITYYAQGKFSQAEKQWQSALKIKENHDIRLNLARAYRDNELFDLAQESLEKALEIRPKSAQAHYELAQLYLKKREFPKARFHFDEVIRLDPLSEMSKASRKYLQLMPPEPTHGG
ncbi:MAG: tetratricopeptide repeat protein [Nitrospina sp.]|nr:tetratricopeptide repeat protein [Nitrospina sp.]